MKPQRSAAKNTPCQFKLAIGVKSLYDYPSERIRQYVPKRTRWHLHGAFTASVAKCVLRFPKTKLCRLHTTYSRLMDIKEFRITSAIQHTRHPWELARLEVIYSLLKSLAPMLLERDAVVFDIGCGDIFLIQELSKRIPRWQFYAIDTAFDEELLAAYDSALKDSNIKAFDSLASACNSMAAAHVDIVLLLDVIEHIEDDVGFLADLLNNTYMSPDTRFLITVPAYQSLFCSHDVFLAHHRRYSRHLLSTNVKKAGLHPFKSGYFFGSLVLPRLLQVAMEKLFPKKEEDAKGVGAWKGQGTIDGLIKSVLVMDFRLSELISTSTPLTLPGLSTYVLCKIRDSRSVD